MRKAASPRGVADGSPDPIRFVSHRPGKTPAVNEGKWSPRSVARTPSLGAPYVPGVQEDPEQHMRCKKPLGPLMDTCFIYAETKPLGFTAD